MKEMIPLFKVFMSKDVDAPLLETLHSGFIGEGKRVLEFEDTLKQFLHTNNVLTLNSGTSALHLAYHLTLSDNSAKTIITTPVTCTATNNPIIHNQGEIVWVDVDPISGNITPETLNEALDYAKFKNKLVAGVSIVHWGGNPCQVDEIAKITQAHNIKLIEDGAHSLGMEYNNKPFGYYADYAIHSFQAIKHITSVDGGCLYCKEQNDYERATLLRWYGIDRTIKEGIDLRCELDIPEAGYKFHMNDICAVIGNANFKHVEKIVNTHRENAKYYDQVFKNKIQFTPETINGRSSYWLYTIHSNNRDELMQKLKQKGIMTSKVHSRNDTHSAFKDAKRNLPGVDQFTATHLCIPVGWWITKEMREYIAEQVLKYNR